MKKTNRILPFILAAFALCILNTGAQAYGGYIRSAAILQSGVSTGIVRDCALPKYTGRDVGEKITACIADLPPTGGTVDARAFEGPQVLTSTIAITRPAKLLLGCAEFTATVDVAFAVTNTATIEGCAGSNATTITMANARATAFQVTSIGAFILRDMTIQSSAKQKSGAFVHLTGLNAQTENNRSLIENVNFRFGWDAIYSENTYGLAIHDCDFTAIQRRAIVLDHKTNGDQGIVDISSNKFMGDSTDLSTRSGSEAIAILSAGGIRIENNYFSTVGIAIHMSWSSDVRNAGQLHIIGNSFESQRTAAIQFDRGTGKTGTFGGVIVDGNFFRSDELNPGDFLRVLDNPSPWLHGLIVTGNLLELTSAVTAGINFVGGSGVGDASYIGGNRIFGNAGTGVKIGSGFTQLVIGENYVTGGLTAYLLQPDQSLPGNGNFHPGNHAFGYLSNGVRLNEPLNLPNSGYLSSRDASNSNWRRVIGMDKSDRIRIAPDGQRVAIDGPIDSIKAIGNIVAGAYATAANCSSSASPAICGTAASGSSAIGPGSRSIQVNTTAVTADSVIVITPDSTLGQKLGVRCNPDSAAQTHYVSGRTPGVSFSIGTTIPAAMESSCINWFIIN